MGLMDGPLEIGPAQGMLGLTGLAGLLRSLRGAREFGTKYDESSRKIFPLSKRSLFATP